MSAENGLQIDRMENGEIWISMVSCGNNAIETYGVMSVLKKCTSYEEVLVAWSAMNDESCDEYVYTEHGGDLPSCEELMKGLVCFLGSTVRVQFDRPCACVDARDLARNLWRVIERRHAPFPQRGEERIVCENVSYAEAMNQAQQYVRHLPGEKSLEVPTLFRNFHDEQNHDCDRDHFSL